MSGQQTLGGAFANALAAKDFARIEQLMDPGIQFRALTPRRHWEADSAREAIGQVLRRWFEESDEIESLVLLETDAFADRERVGYRFSVSNPEGRFLVEQQAFLSGRDGRIDWMRVVCSGFRPVD